MNELSELLRTANKDDWSSRTIAARAGELGHKVGHATVNNYMAGRVPSKPSEEILQALAAVFRVPLGKLREAAQIAAEVTDISLPPEASRLTPRQWAAVREIIMSMVNPGEVQGEATVTAIGSARAKATVNRKAAREGNPNIPD